MDNNIYRLGKDNWPEDIIIYTDGASRGNPGPASIGIYIIDTDGVLLLEYGAKIGINTNNVAEYTAVLTSIEEASKRYVSNITLKSDSQLLVRQLLGEYKVKNKGLRQIYLKCKELEKKFTSIKWEHVRREFNKKADSIANESLDI